MEPCNRNYTYTYIKEPCQYVFTYNEEAQCPWRTSCAQVLEFHKAILVMTRRRSFLGQTNPYKHRRQNEMDSKIYQNMKFNLLLTHTFLPQYN